MAAAVAAGVIVFIVGVVRGDGEWQCRWLCCVVANITITIVTVAVVTAGVVVSDALITLIIT